MSSSLFRKITSHPMYSEISRFAVVGGLGYSSDVVVFNVLRSTTSVESIWAKALSLTISTVVSFIGNRQWTYREHTAEERSAKIPVQGLVFVTVTVIGMLIQMAFLWFSHYVLGFTSLLADNISGNLLGMAVATVFRFWGYRTWVFRRMPQTGTTGPGAKAAFDGGAVHNAHPADEGDPTRERSPSRPLDLADTDW